MRVLLGNDAAIESYYDENGDIQGKPVEGQRVTEFVLPDGTSLQDALVIVASTLPFHFTEGSLPKWVESDSPGLEAILKEQYGISDKTARPPSWGQDTGAQRMTLDGPGSSE